MGLSAQHMGDAAADWFGLYTEMQGEFRALAGLQQLQIQCYLPTMTVCQRIRGRMAERQSPLLTRYLFVHLAGWRLSETRAVVGVQEILPHGRVPEPISAREIENLQEREQSGEFVFKPTVSDRRRQRRVLRSLAELVVLKQVCDCQCCRECLRAAAA